MAAAAVAANRGVFTALGNAANAAMNELYEMWNAHVTKLKRQGVQWSKLHITQHVVLTVSKGCILLDELFMNMNEVHWKNPKVIMQSLASAGHNIMLEDKAALEFSHGRLPLRLLRFLKNEGKVPYLDGTLSYYHMWDFRMVHVDEAAGVNDDTAQWYNSNKERLKACWSAIDAAKSIQMPPSRNVNPVPFDISDV